MLREELHKNCYGTQKTPLLLVACWLTHDVITTLRLQGRSTSLVDLLKIFEPRSVVICVVVQPPLCAGIAKIRNDAASCQPSYSVVDIVGWWCADVTDQRSGIEYCGHPTLRSMSNCHTHIYVANCYVVEMPPPHCPSLRLRHRRYRVPVQE